MALFKGICKHFFQTLFILLFILSKRILDIQNYNEDFIRKNAEIWSGKKIFCLTAMGPFSGDGTGCGLCAKVCPMHNITMDSGKPIAEERCTMCYRCISLCPKQAITLLGKDVVAQYRFKDYEQ